MAESQRLELSVRELRQTIGVGDEPVAAPGPEA